MGDGPLQKTQFLPTEMLSYIYTSFSFLFVNRKDLFTIEKKEDVSEEIMIAFVKLKVNSKINTVHPEK